MNAKTTTTFDQLALQPALLKIL